MLRGSADRSVRVEESIFKRKKRNDLTTLLHGFIGQVLAVFHAVAHLAAVDTLPVLAAELSGPITLCDCCEKATEKMLFVSMIHVIYDIDVGQILRIKKSVFLNFSQ